MGNEDRLFTIVMLSIYTLWTCFLGACIAMGIHGLGAEPQVLFVIGLVGATATPFIAAECIFLISGSVGKEDSDMAAEPPEGATQL